MTIKSKNETILSEKNPSVHISIVHVMHVVDKVEIKDVLELIVFIEQIHIVLDMEQMDTLYSN